MKNILEEYCNNLGMPLHNPYFVNGIVRFHSDIIRSYVEVEQEDMIKSIVPKPLIYDSKQIYININIVKEATVEERSFKYPTPIGGWEEVLIQIPVKLDGESFAYVSDLFISDPSKMVADREIFGMPAVVAKIIVERNEVDHKVDVLTFDGKEKIISINFKAKKKPPKEGSKGEEGDEKTEEKGRKYEGKTIMLKHIPSAILDASPEVKQLVSMKYGENIIYKLIPGISEIEYSTFAPEYLKQSRIKRIVGAQYIDIRHNILGGKVIYDYNSPTH